MSTNDTGGIPGVNLIVCWAMRIPCVRDFLVAMFDPSLEYARLVAAKSNTQMGFLSDGVDPVGEGEGPITTQKPITTEDFKFDHNLILDYGTFGHTDG